MADATPTEVESKPVGIPPPPAPTIEYRRLFKETIAPTLIGVSLAVATLGARHFLTPVEFPKQSITLAIGEPVTHPNLVEVEQETLKASIANELKNYVNDQERIDRTMQWKEMIEQVVLDPRLNIPEKERGFWIQTMLEITFVESGGNPKANSGIAYGLTQLQVDTAKEVAKQYKIPAYNLFNGWDNLFLGTAHQLNMAKLYGKDLGPWIHHLGMGNMTPAIMTYLISVQKLPISEVDSIFLDPTNTLLPKYIAKYQITPVKLLTSPAVTGKLKELNAFNDDTQYYDIRLKAAGEAMNIVV